MNTRTILISSALFMGVLGLLASFLPQEILQFLNIPATGAMPLLVQLMGALYLGFGMLNWMSKGVLLGGIYNRPLAMGNFLHFFVGAMALIKAVPLVEIGRIETIALVSVYAIFGGLFGVITFRHPVATKEVEPVKK